MKAAVRDELRINEQKCLEVQRPPLQNVLPKRNRINPLHILPTTKFKNRPTWDAEIPSEFSRHGIHVRTLIALVEGFNVPLWFRIIVTGFSLRKTAQNLFAEQFVNFPLTSPGTWKINLKGFLQESPLDFAFGRRRKH